MTFKRVMRYDPTQKKIRLFRLLWRRRTPGLPGGGYSAKISVSLVPQIFGWTREWSGWRFTLAGIQVHHLKSFGGTIP